MQAVIERAVETRGVQSGTEIFLTRTNEILAFLSCPEIDVFWTSLTKSPRLLDLFTGTGAGINAACDRLRMQGIYLSTVVGVDRFGLRLEHRPAAVPVYRKSGYSLCQAETEFNLRHLLPTSVKIIQADALEYVSKLHGKQNSLDFDLVTAFSLPLHGTSPEGILYLVSILLYTDLHNVPAIFTFAQKSAHQIANLQKKLGDLSLTNRWAIYEKPACLGNRDWDCWVLSNRPLGFHTKIC